MCFHIHKTCGWTVAGSAQAAIVPGSCRKAGAGGAAATQLPSQQMVQLCRESWSTFCTVSSRLRLLPWYKICYSHAVKSAMCFSSHFLFLHFHVRTMRYLFFPPSFPSSTGIPVFSWPSTLRKDQLFPLGRKVYCTVTHRTYYCTAEQGGYAAGKQQFRKIHCVVSKSVTNTPVYHVTGFNKVACYNFHCHAFSTQ